MGNLNDVITMDSESSSSEVPNLPDISNCDVFTSENEESYDDTVLMNRKRIRSCKKIFSPKPDFKDCTTVVYSAFTNIINRSKQKYRLPSVKLEPSEETTKDSEVLKDLELLESLERRERENLAAKEILEEQLRMNKEQGKTIEAAKPGPSSPRRMSLRFSMRESDRKQVNSEGGIVKTEPPADEISLPSSSSTESTTPAEVVIPVNENYKYYEAAPKHKYVPEMAEMNEEFKTLYFQPQLPNNLVRVPVMREETTPTFYFLDLPAEIAAEAENHIIKLGGIVTTFLGSASRVLFMPQNNVPMKRSLLFTLLTAAVAGRFLLPLKYIEHSVMLREFAPVEEYESLSAHEDPTLSPDQVAAVNMSLKYRLDYGSECVPFFNFCNVLFCEPDGEHEDVKLLLQLLGAYVQPYTVKKFVSNQTVSLIITSNKTPLPEIAKVTPQLPPNSIRKILWKDFENYRTVNG